MVVILASANKKKIKEIEELLPKYEVIPYIDILGKFEIEENGKSFKENAILKIEAVQERLQNINYKEKYLIIADDSGITIPLLNNDPNIYSARYAGIGATDKENNLKVIKQLKDLQIKKTEAFYTACIAMGYNNKIYTTHGWFYGDVIDSEIGTSGFGYDPLFIPKGYDKTLGEMDNNIKKELRHRGKALKLMIKLFNNIS